MEPYKWVSEGGLRKFDRAIQELKKSKLEVTEEAVKALYVKYGGLVLDENFDEAAEEETVEVKPKRRRLK